MSSRIFDFVDNLKPSLCLIRLPVIFERIQECIVTPALGDRAGVLGAIALARQAVKEG